MPHLQELLHHFDAVVHVGHAWVTPSILRHPIDGSGCVVDRLAPWKHHEQSKSERQKR